MLTDNDIINIFYTEKGRINGHLTKDGWLNDHIDIKEYLHNRYIDSESIIETIYRIKNKIEERPVCQVCGNPVKYNGTHGYRTTCSVRCAKQYIKDVISISDKTIILNDLIDNGSLNNNKLQDQYLKSHGYFDYIYSIYADSVSKSEKIYRLYHNIEEIPKCEECGKQLVYKNFIDGYGIYCNDICEQKNRYANKIIKDNDIIDILFDNNELIYPRLEIKFLKAYHIYDYIINRYDDSKNITEIVYRIKNGIEEIPKCKICGKPVKFIKYSIGYSNTCGNINCTRVYNESNSIKKSYIDDQYIIDHIDYKTCRKHDLILNGTYEYIKNRYKDSKSLTESLYRIKNNIESVPSCSICGSPVKFISPSKGYNQTCSFSCSTRTNTINYYKSLGYNISINDIDKNIIVHDACNKHNTIILDKQDFLRRIKNDENICPICNPHKYTNIEKEIANILDKLKVQYYFHDRKHIYPYELDLFLPDYNVGIECNGIYWHSEYKVEKHKHEEKFKLCNDNGIRLITFWEDTILNNINKIESYLKAILGFNERIYARQCNIQNVDSKTAKKFLDENHLQGNISAPIRLGLFYNDVLVELMTFGKTRKPLGGKQEEGMFELYRLCTLDDYTIVGGASKLLSYFKNNYEWDTIITYCENDISLGNVYEKIGFKFDKNCSVGYWYYDKSGKRYNRYSLRKHNIDDHSGRTADEILKDLGYIKCYNSGNKKYIIKKEVQY